MSWAHHVLSVVHQLADVVRPSFGPLGRDQLIHSHSTLLVTNSSSTILESLVTSPHFLPDNTPPSHRAIASVILNQLRQCVEQQGDGSGAILLMLEAAMREVLVWMRERSVSDAEDDSVRGRAQYAKAARALLRALDAVAREWLQVTDEGGETKESGLMAEMRAVGQPIDSSFPALLAAFQQLLHTQHAGKFGGNVVNVLQAVVVDFLSKCYKPGCDISDICESVRSTQPLAIATPASVSQSVVLRGLLLDRGVATRDMPSRVTDVGVLVLACSLSPEVAAATITIRDEAEYQRMLQSAEHSVRALLLQLRERGCNVLLSSVAQHQSTLQMCSQLSITVVQHLSDAELQRVCLYTGAVLVSTPHEVAATPLGRASLLRSVQLGNRVCTQLDVDDSMHVHYKPHTLVLAAASDGIAKQYQQAVMRTFTLLAQFTSLASTSAAARFVLPGAGATEAELSFRCSDRYSSTVPSSVGWRVMAVALMAVPRALYAAACSEDDVAYARFIEVEVFIHAQASHQRSALGMGQHNSAQHTEQSVFAAGFVSCWRVCILCVVVLIAVLLSPKQCDVDGVIDSLQRQGSTHISPSPTALRLPPLLSLSSPLSVGLIDSPAVKHSVITCMISLLRTLLRVDTCIQINNKQTHVGRMVRLRTAGERKGKGWVGRSRDSANESSDESDSEWPIE